MKYRNISRMTGWLCRNCGTVTLEYKRTRPIACAECGLATFTGMVTVMKQTDPSQQLKKVLNPIEEVK